MRDPTRQSRGLIRVAAQLALRTGSGQRLREKLTTCQGSEAGLTFHLPEGWVGAPLVGTEVPIPLADFAGCQGGGALHSRVSWGRVLEGQPTPSPLNQNLAGPEGGTWEPGHGPG